MRTILLLNVKKNNIYLWRSSRHGKVVEVRDNLQEIVSRYHIWVLVRLSVSAFAFPSPTPQPAPWTLRLSLPFPEQTQPLFSLFSV